MAIGDNINYYKSASSFKSEQKLLNELNNLRRKNELDLDKLTQDLIKKKYDDQLKKEKSLYDRRLKLADDFNKKAEKKRKALDEAEYKAWEAKEKKKLNKQIEDYKKYLDKIKEAEASRESKKKTKEAVFGNVDIRSKFSAIKKEFSNEGLLGVIDVLVSGIADEVKKLDSTINTIAEYQGRINTRLYGSGKKWDGWGTSSISGRLQGIVGVSPLIQTKKLYENVDTLVNKGISYNLEQRAFLETIAGKIATTFHADNQTLLQLIRVQQADTTAARLGLEAELNRYFNSMYETTEYLSDSFDTVSSQLYEAMSQMSATSGVGFEYQVQKWLGSLYSVGMSQGAVGNLAAALGMLGSGNISGLSSNQGMQNLLVMAASRAGKSYSSLLTGGLTADTTNELLAAMVNYLADIAETTKDNLVVRSQYANIFGLSVSDLAAMANLAPSVRSITGNRLDYGGAMQSLTNQANMMYSRTSVGEMLGNAWSNLQYTMAQGVAANPALYAIWKIANALDQYVGGIALPDIKYMGTGVNLQTTVADIMRVSALGTGLLGGIGNIISAGAGGGIFPLMMLNALGLTGNKVSMVSRGAGTSTALSGTGTSASTYVGNVSGSDVYEASIAGTEETKAETMAQVKEENADEVTNKVLDGHITDIYDLLSSIIVNGAMKVSVDNYGLTGSEASNFN